MENANGTMKPVAQAATLLTVEEKYIISAINCYSITW